MPDGENRQRIKCRVRFDMSRGTAESSQGRDRTGSAPDMLTNLRKEEFASIEAWRASFIELLAAALFVFLGAGSVIITGSLTDGEILPFG